LADCGIQIAFQAGYLTLARHYPTEPVPTSVALAIPNEDTSDFLASAFFASLRSKAVVSKYEAWSRALLLMDVDKVEAAGTDLLAAVSAEQGFSISNETALRIVLASPFAGNGGARLSARDGSVRTAAEVTGEEAGVHCQGVGVQGVGRRPDIVMSWADSAGDLHMLVMELKFLRWSDWKGSASKLTTAVIDAVDQMEQDSGEFFDIGAGKMKKLRVGARKSVIDKRNWHGMALVAGALWDRAVSTWACLLNSH
jgi:hypothetical protein